QSHLHGIIAQLQILGITVVSVHEVPDAPEEDHD
ncbi:MAG: hypothetical protein JWR81_6701, partial [Pseudonocardia sp.]|nr:hypothetical protein [Pseudonocardia sp.]